MPRDGPDGGPATEARNGRPSASARARPTTERPWLLRIPAYAVGPPRVASNGFAQAPQAGLSAILSIASAAAPPAPHPAAAPPKPRLAAVIERPAIAIRRAARPAEAVAARRAHGEEPTAGPHRGASPAAIGALPLTVIVTVQFVLSLRLITRNTAFTDEALYLWAGRLEWSHWLHHTSLPAFPSYFSGAPVLYPPVVALANSVGGLVGARVLSLCFMLGATVLLHGVTRRVFDRQSAAFAAALFAALGSAQFLGAFATYDAMALFLLAASTWLGIRAASCRTTRARLGLILGAALTLAVADATKYAAALFDPVVLIVIACAHWRQLGRQAGAVAALLAAGATALGIGAALAWGGEPYITGIVTTTLSRQPGNWPIFGILFVSAGWVGTIAVLAAIGAVAVSCARRPAPMWVLAWVLAAAAFLAPAEQARIHVFTSLFKHVAFGGWFGAAVAGYALTAFIRAVPTVKSRGAFKVVTAAVAAMTVSGSMLAIDHFGTWQNIEPGASGPDRHAARSSGHAAHRPSPAAVLLLGGVRAVAASHVDPGFLAVGTLTGHRPAAGRLHPAVVRRRRRGMWQRGSRRQADAGSVPAQHRSSRPVPDHQ